MVAVPSIGRATEVTPRRRAPEADATRDLYERYARQIHSYCLHQLGSREEAEDAVQSTFLNAFRGLKRGVDPEFESAWLYKIAENVCLTRQRSSYRRRRIESPGDLDAMQDILPSHESDNDALIGLPAALEGMPEQQRRALLLREWQGLSYREIAGELGLSQSAVETLLFRARRSLANALTDEFGAKKTGLGRLRAGGDAGSLVALVKAVVFSSGAKVAATVAAVAATSAVAATPAVRHSAESAFTPVHAPRAKAAPARHARRSTRLHASPAVALGATLPRPQAGKRVAATSSRAASASHLRLVPAASATSSALTAPSPRHTADDPIATVPQAPAPPVVDVPVAPATDSVPIPAVPTPVDTGAGTLPPAPPTPTVKDPGKGPQSDTPVVVVTPLTVQVDAKAARKAAKADEKATRDHGKKRDTPVSTPPTVPAPTDPSPTPTTLPPAAIAPAPPPVDAQPAALAAPAAGPTAVVTPTPAATPPAPVVSDPGNADHPGNGGHGERNGHRK